MVDRSFREGLRYKGNGTVSAQTERRGEAEPVRLLPGS
jgi:hypothetical protein